MVTKNVLKQLCLCAVARMLWVVARLLDMWLIKVFWGCNSMLLCFLCCSWALQRYLECLVVCVNFKRKSHYEKLCEKNSR